MPPVLTIILSTLFLPFVVIMYNEGASVPGIAHGIVLEQCPDWKEED